MEMPPHLIPTTERGKKNLSNWKAKYQGSSEVKYHHKVLCNEKTNELYFIAEKQKAYENSNKAKTTQLRCQVEVAKSCNKIYKNHKAFSTKNLNEGNKSGSGWYDECDNPELLAPKEKKTDKNGVKWYKRINDKKDYEDYDKFVNKCLQYGMKKGKKNKYMTDTDLTINNPNQDFDNISKIINWNNIHSLDDYKKFILNKYYKNFDYDCMSLRYDFGEGFKTYNIFNTEFMKYPEDDSDTDSEDDINIYKKVLEIVEQPEVKEELEKHREAIVKSVPKYMDIVSESDNDSDSEEEYVEERKTYENTFDEFYDIHIDYSPFPELKQIQQRELYFKYKDWCKDNNKDRDFNIKKMNDYMRSKDIYLNSDTKMFEGCLYM
jgi:hypothetical protein